MCADIRAKQVYVPHNCSDLAFNEHVIHLDKMGFTENIKFSMTTMTLFDPFNPIGVLTCGSAVCTTRLASMSKEHY